MVDSKENNVNMVNSNDKVAMMVDLKVSTTDDLKKRYCSSWPRCIGEKNFIEYQNKAHGDKIFFMEPRKKSWNEEVFWRSYLPRQILKNIWIAQE